MQEIDPTESPRAYAFEMWMKAPMPMVTLFRTLNVSNLIKISRRGHVKFNMLMCWCVGMAATRVREFYTLPVGGKLIRYDSLAVSTIVANARGEISSCDIPFSNDIRKFNADYLLLTERVASNSRNYDIADRMVIGTSALARYEIDGAVGMYSGVFNNPFLIWGKYRKRRFRTEVTLSFQFHHAQMDGAHAARFLDILQNTISSLPARNLKK